MDILERLTADFDHLRDLTIDLSVATTSQEREQAFRQLCRLQDVTMKAQTSVMNHIAELSFALRKMLERADVMEDIAIAIQKSRHADSREVKMDLYSDLVIQSIHDCEREVLPFLFDHVSQEQRESIGAMYNKYCAIALDVPHAS